MPFDPRPSSPQQLAVVAIILLVLARFGLFGRLTPWVFDLALMLLLVAALGWWAHPRRRRVTWRDRVIDISDHLTWWERLYYLAFRA